MSTQGEEHMAQIEIESELATVFGEPTILAKKKDLNHIDPHARAFISRSPFLVLSTADAEAPARRPQQHTNFVDRKPDPR